MVSPADLMKRIRVMKMFINYEIKDSVTRFRFLSEPNLDMRIWLKKAILLNYYFHKFW